MEDHDKRDEGLTARSLSRRDFLKMAGIAGATVGVGASLSGLVAACGGTEATTTTAAPATTTTAAAATTTTAAAAGTTTTAAAAGTTTTAAAAAAWTADTIQAKYGAKHYAMAIHSMSEVLYKNWEVGAKDMIAAFGKDNSFNIFEHGMDESKVVNDLQSAGQADLNAINIVPLSGAQAKLIDRVLQPKQIYYATHWQTSPWFTPLDAGDYWAFWMSTDDFQAGYDMAKILFDHMGGKGNVVHIEGYPGATASTLRTMGIDKCLSEHPDVKLLARKPGNWLIPDSQNLMEAWLTAYPQIDGVIGQNDACGIGAYNAIRNAKKEIPVVSMDGSQESITPIKDSFYLATLATCPYWQCGFSLVRFFDQMNGWKPSPEERMLFEGYVPVTKDNAAKYLDAYWGGKGTGFDWVKMSHVLHPDDWDPQMPLTMVNPQTFWTDVQKVEKPANYNLPEGYATADYAKFNKMYDDHYKTRPFG
jgi:ribose transport system substrate-binding protein